MHLLAARILIPICFVSEAADQLKYIGWFSTQKGTSHLIKASGRLQVLLFLNVPKKLHSCMISYAAHEYSVFGGPVWIATIFKV